MNRPFEASDMHPAAMNPRRGQEGIANLGYTAPSPEISGIAEDAAKAAPGSPDSRLSSIQQSLLLYGIIWSVALGLGFWAAVFLVWRYLL